MPKQIRNFVILFADEDYDEMVDNNYQLTKYPQVKFVNKDSFLGKMLRCQVLIPVELRRSVGWPFFVIN